MKAINESIIESPVLIVTQLEITYKFLLYYTYFKSFKMQSPAMIHLFACFSRFEKEQAETNENSCPEIRR